MHDWNWNPETRSVGAFSLDSPISDVSHFISQLERFDYEEFDTYLIEETKGSKLFVKDGLIKSIQCGDHFFVQGIDVIGRNGEETQSIFGFNFTTHPFRDGGADYINDLETVKLIAWEDTVAWVVVNADEKREENL